MYDKAVELESDDSLGRYIPLMVLILVYVQRQALTEIVKEPWPPGLLMVAGATILHVVAYLVQQIPISFLAFLLGLYGITGMFWGKAWLRGSFFLFAVLAFAMPIEPYIEGLTFKMRHFSAAVSTGICTTLLSLNLDRQGAMVSNIKPDGTIGFQFEVAAACSGMRSLKVIVLLTLIYGFLSFQTVWRRLLLIAIAPVLAIAGNILRLVFTFSVGEISPEYAKKFETNAGYITFGVALAGVLLLGRWLREPEVTPGNSDPNPNSDLITEAGTRLSDEDIDTQPPREPATPQHK